MSLHPGDEAASLEGAREMHGIPAAQIFPLEAFECWPVREANLSKLSSCPLQEDTCLCLHVGDPPLQEFETFTTAD